MVYAIVCVKERSGEERREWALGMVVVGDRRGEVWGLVGSDV
jgi:hypothetical protein